MTEEEQVQSSPAAQDVVTSADSGDTADILAELDELADSSNTAEKSKPSTDSTTQPETSSSVAPAPAPTPDASSSNAWSWNILPDITGAVADVEAVMDGENTDLGATKADIQEMESAIASVEEVVSSTMFSAFSSVTETLGGTTTTGTGKKKKTKKKGGVPVDDSDLDALTRGPSVDTEDVTKISRDNASTNASAKESDKPAGNDAAAAGEATSGGWTSWTDSLATDTTELLTSTTTSILPNFPAPPPLDADGNEIPQPKEEEAPLPSASDAAAEAAAAASSSIWSAFSAVSDTILQTASNESTGTPKSPSAAQPSNMLMQLYTSKVNQAAEWIEDLENEENSKDPYKHLKQHLKDYIKDHPTGTYEGWIQKWVQEQGWGEEEDEVTTTETPATGTTGEGNDGGAEESAVTIIIDPSYYKEESIHRTFWNEKNYADGIAVDDENAPRKYVEVRGPSVGKRVSQ